MAQINISFTSPETHEFLTGITFECNSKETFINYLRSNHSDISCSMLNPQNDFRRFVATFLDGKRIFSLSDIEFNASKVELEILPSISGG